MKILTGILLLPLMMGNMGRGRDKIDTRLLKKTRTLGLSKIPAIIISKEDKVNICRTHLESKGVQIKYELPLINSFAVEIEGGKLEEAAKLETVEYISDDAKMTSLLNVAAQEVGARIANDTGYTGRGIGIAILTPGIYPHPDFTRLAESHYCFFMTLLTADTVRMMITAMAHLLPVAAGNDMLLTANIKEWLRLI